MWRAAKDHSAGDPLIILPLRRREIGHRKRRVQRKGSGKFTARLSPRLRVGQGKKRFFLVASSLRLVMSCLYSVIQRAFAAEDGVRRDLQRRPLDSAKCLHIDVQAVQMGDCISLLHIQHPCCQMPCKWHTIPHLVRVQARAQVSTFAYRSECHKEDVRLCIRAEFHSCSLSLY